MITLIDIGSNTLKAMIYTEDGEFLSAFRNKIQLINHVKDGVLDEEGIEKLIGTLTYLCTYNDFRKFAYATSALRDLNNKKEIVNLVADKTGIRIKILTAEEEAKYTYDGVHKYCTETNGLIVDIGGGSTELISYSNDDINGLKSLNLGCVRQNQLGLDELKRVVKETLDANTIEVNSSVVIGHGGTITSGVNIIKKVYGLTGDNIEVKYFDEFVNKFETDEKAATLDILQSCPDRFDSIITGFVIFNEICHKYGIKTLIVSHYGLKDGYLINRVF